jgi:molybdopterin-guanine dinucleotide biosynthesis protein A
MTLTAVLLAGGESRRMGRDKATIEFGGQPLWRRQLEVLRAVGPEKIFVSARTLPPWQPDDAELIEDDAPSRGPLSGLTQALAAMRTTHLLALAVDMPLMTSKQLNVLCGLAGEGRGVIPVMGERAEPLAAIYPAEAATDFATALAGTDFSLQRIIRKLAADEKVRLYAVPVKDEHLYRSVNEPSNLKEGRFPNRPPKNAGGL